MATKGTRWFLRRSVDLIPYMLFMAAREALIEPREWARRAGGDAAQGPPARPRASRGRRPAGGRAAPAEPVAE